MTCIALVTEDEALVRILAIDFLQEAGVEVIAVLTAREAIEILDERALEIRLLFTAMRLPGGIDGLSLAYHVHQNWPWVALLIASGKAALEASEIPPGSRFLTKPYALAELLKHAQELITARNGLNAWPSSHIVSEFS